MTGRRPFVRMAGSVSAVCIVLLCAAQDSRAERPRRSRFTHADTNGDGIIDAEELRRFQDRQSSDDIRMSRRWHKEGLGLFPQDMKRQSVPKEGSKRRKDIQMEMERWQIKGTMRWQAWWEKDADTNGDGIINFQERRSWNGSGSPGSGGSTGFLERSEKMHEQGK